MKTVQFLLKFIFVIASLHADLGAMNNPAAYLAVLTAQNNKRQEVVKRTLEQHSAARLWLDLATTVADIPDTLTFDSNNPTVLKCGAACSALSNIFKAGQDLCVPQDTLPLKIIALDLPIILLHLNVSMADLKRCEIGADIAARNQANTKEKGLLIAFIICETLLRALSVERYRSAKESKSKTLLLQYITSHRLANICGIFRSLIKNSYHGKILEEHAKLKAKVAENQNSTKDPSTPVAAENK